jgi:hypothetical protein
MKIFAKVFRVPITHGQRHTIVYPVKTLFPPQKEHS